MTAADAAAFRQVGPDVLVRVKAVPGSSREGIAGLLGDRLKVRVSAPPEGGRANKAICALLAGALDVKASRVTIDSGAGSAEKTLRVAAATAQAVAARLGAA